MNTAPDFPDWKREAPPESTWLPYWGYHPVHGVIWIFWRGGSLQTKNHPYPAAYECTYYCQPSDLDEARHRAMNYDCEEKPTGVTPNQPMTALESICDAIIVIGLSRRTDRRALFEAEMAKLGIKNYQWFDGYDKPDGSGNRGCTESHRAFLDVINYHKWKRTCVFEDDAKV